MIALFQNALKLLHRLLPRRFRKNAGGVLNIIRFPGSPSADISLDGEEGLTISFTPHLPPPEEFDFRTFDLDGPGSSRTEDIIRSALLRLLDKPEHELDTKTSYHAHEMVKYDWVAWSFGSRDAHHPLSRCETELLSRALMDMFTGIPTCPDHHFQRTETPQFILWSMRNITYCPDCREAGGLEPYTGGCHYEKSVCTRERCATCDHRVFTGKCSMCDRKLSVVMCEGFDAPAETRRWSISPTVECPNYRHHGYSYKAAGAGPIRKSLRRLEGRIRG